MGKFQEFGAKHTDCFDGDKQVVQQGTRVGTESRQRLEQSTALLRALPMLASGLPGNMAIPFP